jgi:hypothetical protein
LAEELTELAIDDDPDADNARQLLEDAEVRGDVFEFNGKYWVVRQGEYSFGEFDHSV